MRPQKDIDWKIVDAMLEADCEGTEVAARIGIHPDTLYLRCQKEKGMGFSEYLREKKANGNSLIKEKQFEAATVDKDRSMLIWLGKQRLGQKDKLEQDINDNATKKLEVEITHTETQTAKVKK